MLALFQHLDGEIQCDEISWHVIAIARGANTAECENTAIAVSLKTVMVYRAFAVLLRTLIV